MASGRAWWMALAAEMDFAAPRPQAAGQNLDRGALAHAVAAEQGDHLAGGDLQIHSEQHLAGPVTGFEAATTQQRFRLHAAASAPRYTACTSG